MKIVLLLLFVSLTRLIIAGNYPVGAREAAMSNSSVTLTDNWAIASNQAGLARSKGFTTGIYYQNRFNLSKLSVKSCFVTVPTNSGVWGLDCTHFGYSAYNEIKAGLAYSKAFGKRFAFGMQLDYFKTHIIEGYENKGTALAEIGILSEPLPNFFVATHIFNVFNTKNDDFESQNLATVFRFGVGYNFSDKILLDIETEKDINQKIVLKVGSEMQLCKKLFLRGGFSTFNASHSFGIGYTLKNTTFDMAFSYHPILGYTPHLSLIFFFDKKNATK